MGRFVILLCLVSALAPVALRAQGPAFDSNCYYPQIGNPDEIDTIYGAVNNQELGGYVVRNLGPKPDGSPGNLLIGNLDRHDHAGEYPTFGKPTLYKVQTGPSFNLHQLSGQRQNIDPNSISPGYDFQTGHFHDQSHVDLFDNFTRIYWADDNGDYDSTRFTDLEFNVHGDNGRAWNMLHPYVAHLTSDTIDDILFGVSTDWIDASKDSAFAVLFRGGQTLASKTIAYEDTSAVVRATAISTADLRVTSQGDYRGVGRDDLIVNDNYANLWYYKNDPPFSIGAFAKALTEDTLAVKWQNPHWVQHSSDGGRYRGFLSMRAMPKAAGDRSVDFLPVFSTDDDRDSAIFIFKGGPDFGSHRLFLDSADFVIRSPAKIDPANFEGLDWPIVTPSDAGDMTGTGNRVLDVGGGLGHVGLDFFYVTGKALDDKIDMYCQAYGGFDDTITSNADSLEDFLESGPYYASDDDRANSKQLVGTIWVIKGSKKIPVHLNPKWAAVPHSDAASIASIAISPNPAIRSTVATIEWPTSEFVTVTITDLLGQTLRTESMRIEAGVSELHLSLGSFAPGVYYISVQGRSNGSRATIAIVR